MRLLFGTLLILALAAMSTWNTRPGRVGERTASGESK